MTKRERSILVGTLSAGLMLAAGMASGQDYPNKPIRIITQAVGGGPDFAARLIAQAITGPLGQQVIVDNRPASATAAADAAFKAPPDGYTLLVHAGSLWLTQFIQDNVSYDAVRDFSPITLVATSPSFVVVHPSLPVKSIKELIALAKARPGELNYGTGTAGGANHLAAELFKTMAAVNMMRIPYKGGSVLMNDVIGGQVQLTFASGGAAAPHIKSGRLRALAVTSAKPSAVFPNLPPVAATVPGYEAIQILGIWARAKTPAAIVNRLNQEIVLVLNKADMKERFLSSAQEVVGNSPEEFAAVIKSDMAKMGKLIRDAGIRAE